jgi:hypothetical protein
MRLEGRSVLRAQLRKAGNYERITSRREMYGTLHLPTRLVPRRLAADSTYTASLAFLSLRPFWPEPSPKPYACEGVMPRHPESDPVCSTAPWRLLFGV